jgi:hypothetical protein
MRLFTILGLLLATLRLTAQWTGGPPPTVTSSLFGHPHPIYSGPRGGGPPPNDLCQNVVITTLPADGTAQVSGTNVGATDTENFGNPNVWEAFTTDTCSTVTVGYCGTAPAHTIVYSILIVGCPDGGVSIQNSGTSECGDGNTLIVYENLPAGTYYVPILLLPGESEGPYTITFTSAVCDLPPPNERCIDAITVEVVTDCGLGGTTAGNNSNAVQNGPAPECATTSSQFQDVWYQFNSGANTEVLITLGLGTTGDLGLQVVDACGGNSIFCATGDTAYVVAVNELTFYKVRLFSNNDVGFGGAFTICLSVPQVTTPCDGGIISLFGGGTLAQVCVGSGESLEFVLSTGITVPTAYVLTNGNDTVISVLSGALLNTGTLAVGTYHVWALSYDGDLVNAVPGVPIDSITSTGACAERSATPVTVSVEICEGLVPTEPASLLFQVVASENGPVLVWNDRPLPVRLDVFDMAGGLKGRGDRMMRIGDRYGLGPLSAGLYAVRAAWGDRATVVRFVMP